MKLFKLFNKDKSAIYIAAKTNVDALITYATEYNLNIYDIDENDNIVEIEYIFKDQVEITDKGEKISLKEIYELKYSQVL
jgi:hypothetical protein